MKELLSRENDEIISVLNPVCNTEDYIDNFLMNIMR